ncbi:MAG: hypothetical protein JKY50_13610 [Oleispira sp.]|nr:hypothetical protein [Oleispira sp.]MBL4882446.1 hypothetical protein [Oleispira sp.]
MISVSMVLFLLCLYAVCQYGIARWGQSSSGLAEKVRLSATTYTLSLAVFCTSWTYYGSIGQATNQGIQHVSLYLGSSLAFIFLVPMYKKMVRIKAYYHTTSIADFISTRYNHSSWLAGLISLLCLVGITPYISIQLKSVINSAQLLITPSSDSQYFLQQLDIAVVLLMAAFTIVFGVRKLDPTERHPGMMVALAAESLFKLIAFLTAALFICFVVFDGLDELLSVVVDQASSNQNFSVFNSVPSVSSWLTTLTLGIIGVIALPRQFHVGIIECANEKVLDRARWLFPLYLFIINFFVIPIAIAGQIAVSENQNPDLILLNIPLLHDATFISMLVFLGGFAAATGMIMVSAMTLSTMATNHLLLPVIEHFSKLHFLRRQLLYVRWFMVIYILFSSLYYYRAIGDSELIVRIGSISFVAIAQLIPALLIGLVWRKGNYLGAIIGISSGMIIWFYSLMLPSVINSGWLESNLLSEGLFGFSWLRPEYLFGLTLDSSVGHSLFWSLLINTCLYILISEKTYQYRLDDDELSKFFQIANSVKVKNYRRNLIANICLSNKLSLLFDLISLYLPDKESKNKLELCCQQCEVFQLESIDIFQLSQLRSKVTSMLAGIIGMAAANSAIRTIELLNDKEQQLLSNSYSDLLAQSQMSPDDLLEKVDFYQEKQKLLENHSKLQSKAIAELEQEHNRTLEAKHDLDELNQQLEIRIKNRTQDLELANQGLTGAISELKTTQNKLLEADKMASLGRVVAGVAHEINTPVGIILTALSSLKDEISILDTQLKNNAMSKNSLSDFMSYSQEVCQISLANIKRAAHLIDSFKQMAVSQETEEKEVFQIKECIEHSIISSKGTFADIDLTFHIECDPALTMNSYQSAFIQIIHNLVLNSCVHGFENKPKGSITIKAIIHDELLLLDYHDDGKGLDEEGKQNIFEPFYTTRRGSGNSGLGSHLIFNLVTQLFQGEILIDDSTKLGLGFNIQLPLTIS